MMNQTIYLDHAATTPLDPAVLDIMQPYLLNHYGNPSSIHHAGRLALHAVDEARDTVAQLLGSRAREIIFTSGGSEANNLAIRGVALAQREAGCGNHIITAATEHHAVLHTVEYLQQAGFTVTLLPVNAQGLIAPEALQDALQPDTVLVTLMYANNEIGVIQPLAEFGAICRAHSIPFHTDAVQAAGSLPLFVDDLNVDLMSIAAHKFYGPKGIGALYVRRGTPLLPQIIGGGQERRRRAGTENVPGIVGLAAALRLAEERRAWYRHHCTTLRDQLIDGVLERIPDTRLNGPHQQRLPNNANLLFTGVDAESILLLLDQHNIYASSGSACTSGSLEPSHVLLAMSLNSDDASSSLRFSVGKDNTATQINHLLALLPGIIEQLRVTVL